MRVRVKAIILLILLSIPTIFVGKGILKFEHIGSKEGLSQNTVLSILCDQKGFLWVGTMNGLNRYDGKNFKVYKSQNNSSEILTNNRISTIWLDSAGYIWLKTYDGFYHLFNQQKETFTTFPSYSVDIEDRNSKATSFCQYDAKTILIGSSASGIYILDYEAQTERYISTQVIPKDDNGNINTNISKIHKDNGANIWILTNGGLYMIEKADFEAKNFDRMKHFLPETAFTSSVAETEEYVYFGTTNGIISYNKKADKFNHLSRENSSLPNDDYVTHLVKTANNKIIIGTRSNAPLIADKDLNEIRRINFHGDNLFDVYVDRHDQAWLTGNNLGLTRLNLQTLETRFYQLTPSNLQSVTDHERHFFYEDKSGNLWIGLHGSGLAAYQREDDSFYFYRNIVNDNNSIPSNIVHCITQDLSGQLWLGTGQYVGGLVKAISSNEAFTHTLPVENPIYKTENVVRAIYEDQKNNVWVATKGGRIHMYNLQGNPTGIIEEIRTEDGRRLKPNTYSIITDRDNYIWLATKGNGLFRSQRTLNEYKNIAKEIIFINYANKTGDASTITDNNLYSLAEDKYGHIWVATFGGGIARLTKTGNKTVDITNITNKNSNLSSKQTRYLKIDASGNLWIATTFGINMLSADQLNGNKFRFRHFLHSANDKNSLSYNDVFHIYEDNGHNLWFGTGGGGVDRLSNLTDSTATFTPHTTTNGLSNDVVYSTIQDTENNFWFGTENGISHKSSFNTNFEIFGQNNGIAVESFSEATICVLSNGNIAIGGNNGFITVDPQLIPSWNFNGMIEFTNMQLFNKEINVNEPGSPLSKIITYTDKIRLKHNQSSISIDYINMDMQNPDQIQYAYMMDGLETSWNYVGNNRRAVYTNLTPGKYIFKLKSTNRNGNWIQNERKLEITINPPWYQTTVAYIVYLVLSITIITIIFRTLHKIQRYRNDLEVEKKLNEVKLQFFTNISHEIRTPLTLIIGPLDDIVRQDDISIKTIAKLKIIRQNANRMLLLTNQILDFRKIQNNKMTLKVSEVDIVNFTQPIFDSFIPLSEHKHINYRFEHSNITKKIWVDPSKLDIIIYNLLSNALKFTPENKSITISITQDDNYTMVTVEDQGPGIPQQLLPELFTRYTILSNGQYAGTGIGLSLSYELAKLHNAELLVDSQPGNGAKFTLKLKNGNSHLTGNPNISLELAAPKQQQDISTQYIDIEPEEEIEKGNKEKRILVVEDNHEIQQYICQSLQHKYDCIKASDGEEALKILAIENPDLIITDIMMPVMDGITLIKNIRNDFNTSHIPIIALTAKTALHSEIEGIESGADAYIHKPFNTSHLLATISSLIKQREQLAEFYGKKEDDKESGLIQPTVNLTSKDEQFINELIKYVEENYKTEFNIDSVAENFAVSRTVLYNKIKALTSMSPLEFVRQIKLQIANQLLLKGYNVSEVAFEVGYSDVKYFSRQFKSQFGVSPSQVKKTPDPQA